MKSHICTLSYPGLLQRKLYKETDTLKNTINQYGIVKSVQHMLVNTQKSKGKQKYTRKENRKQIIKWKT